MENIKTKRIAWKDFESMTATNAEDWSTQWKEAVNRLPSKIIVLDDDPTGVQTVRDVPVYTSWDREACLALLGERSKVVFLLTNSRALSVDDTKALHQRIASNLKMVLPQSGMDSNDVMFILRGDSTLRAHYPAEIDTFTECFYGESELDAEIHVPAFLEGGRYTLHGIHYLKQEGALTPVGETEFAQDPLFAYHNSELGRWIFEKRQQEYDRRQLVYLDIDFLRTGSIDEIVKQMMRAKNGMKIIVDAANETDLKIFCIALSKCIANGKKYIFRAAASVVNALGGIDKGALLGKTEINPEGKPGLIVIGSFVNKTTQQLNALKEEKWIDFYEVKVAQILKGDFERELHCAVDAINKSLERGHSICAYTSRGYYGTQLTESEKIQNSKTISDFLIKMVGGLRKKPGYLIAKGGITSSDIGVKALRVGRALVKGQAAQGVPVWKLGSESLFPGMSYIIFPGNVGEETALRDLAKRLGG